MKNEQIALERKPETLFHNIWSSANIIVRPNDSRVIAQRWKYFYSNISNVLVKYL